MAYDFTGNWGNPKISGHHAQLFATQGGGSSQPAIDYLLSQGFPANKILLGCPCYGWSFLNCNKVNQPCDNCGGSGGAFDYKDLPRPETQEFVDEAPVAAFCVGGDGGFVTYDNAQTVATKADYAKSRGLGGMFFWHVLADAPGNRSLVFTSYTTLHS
jgi:chitinase